MVSDKIYYKVVDNNHESAVAEEYNMPGNFIVKYTVGKWVKPRVKGTKLFVFDDLTAAKSFLQNRWHGGFVYKCKIKNPIKPKYIAELANIENFWKFKFLHKCIPSFIRRFIAKERNISHTVWAEEVKLIEKVQ